ncbi:MAG: hypothetical protein IPO81_28065 [Kouleothrix sp.]|nr:hypothetical protein [Kouleothrix sp.]
MAGAATIRAPDDASRAPAQLLATRASGDLSERAGTASAGFALTARNAPRWRRSAGSSTACRWR